MKKLLLIPLLFAACTALAAESEDLGTSANAILKPLVRVQTQYAGGSGTVIYSEDREGTGEFRTFVLTNWHVVEDAIHVVETWDSLTEKHVYSEDNDQVTVELFMYLRGGRTVVTQPIKADIVAYKKAEDLALLELDYPIQVKDVAKLLPADKSLRLLQTVWAVGCSLGVDPMTTVGHVNDLEEMIEHKPYVMATADIIWGNSGGAVFVRSKGEFYFVGVPSRVAIAGSQAATHMGYFIPPDRIRAWFTREKLCFLVDGETPTVSFEARAKLRKGKDD